MMAWRWSVTTSHLEVHDGNGIRFRDGSNLAGNDGIVLVRSLSPVWCQETLIEHGPGSCWSTCGWIYSSTCFLIDCLTDSNAWT